jgi:membrane protein implicated in regulation of membrane protease activity
MRKKYLGLCTLAIWLFLVLAFMILARTVDMEVFFVLWLIGILIIVELVSDLSATPRYLRVVRMVIAAGVVLFGFIVARKILEILQQ